MEEVRELRFECINCGNCCTDKNTIVNLTYHDILRIKNGLNLELKELIEVVGFYVFKHQISEEELSKMVVPPIETENGLAFVALRKVEEKDYACYFYNKANKKCQIYKLRPNFCRTFPFFFKIIFNKDDPQKAKIKMDLTDKSVEYCPGIGKDAPLIDDKEWIQIGKQTIENLNDDIVLIGQWNTAVEEKKIAPSASNYLLTVSNLDDAKN